MSEPDHNDLAFWFPRLVAYGLPAPDTVIVKVQDDLTCVLDGEESPHWGALVKGLVAAGDVLGWPCFLRTGHGSGKHDWRNTCFVQIPEDVEEHVFRLVEWSHLVDLMGLPTRTWAIRRMLDVEPLFVCERYGGMPVTREFRVFANDQGVYHTQPYWPPDAVRLGGPSDRRWEKLLAEASELGDEDGELGMLALEARTAVGGDDWSVDLLQDRGGKWWVTDMALAEDSFRWDP